MPADRLAGGLQLPPRTFGERVRAHRAEQLVRQAQLLAGVDPAPLPAQPLTVEQAGAGERRPDPGPAQPLDRLPVQGVGRRPLADLGRAFADVPRAQSVPLALAISSSLRAASAARAGRPLLAAASTSSIVDQVDSPSSSGFSAPRSAASYASS
ncbi:hypothetical protein [[Actinomadura] parvosata]|uniref:hypothetical protein n=1 Tax=[Actinomadura] parvosata TaxID=1955412 RepID=UPI001C904C81|nr:hypothetical protein [Nonomuraea sp. ATCC 55076]